MGKKWSNYLGHTALWIQTHKKGSLPFAWGADFISISVNYTMTTKVVFREGIDEEALENFQGCPDQQALT